MNIVVDTSVLVAVIANEPKKSALIELTKGTDLIAPSSVHWEIGNAFSAMLKRKRITLSQARTAIGVYERILVKFVDVDLVETLDIAERLGIYAYDAYILQCALKYDCPLVSLDESLVTHAQQMKIQVLEVPK